MARVTADDVRDLLTSGSMDPTMVEWQDTDEMVRLQMALDSAEQEVERLRQTLTNTRDALEVVYRSLEGHFETLRRLAFNYPESHHTLDSPRRHDSVVLLEQIIRRLDILLDAKAPRPPRGVR